VRLNRFLPWILIVVTTVATPSAQRPSRETAVEWLRRAADAMGGETALRAIAALEITGVSVWHQREQSERPEGPWIPTFTEFRDVRNVRSATLVRSQRIRGFVEVDADGWSPMSTLLVTGDAAVRRTGDGVAPAQMPTDLGTLPADLGPERVVLAALEAADLRTDSDVQLHRYAHHVVSFTHGGARVRLMLSPPTLLPKAIEITRPRPFETYWAPWGDVTQRVTFGVWLLEREGLRYPRLWEYSTDGAVDVTVDVTRVRVNPPVAEADFTLSDAARQLIAARRRVADQPFGSPQRPVAELAAGIVKVPSSWDIVEVKQDDGIVVIEAPLTSSYSAKVIEDAEHRFPGARVKALVTTSDAWPHIGGIREYVARGVPVYALNLNVPILDRLVAARFDTEPDALARAPRKAGWRIVSSHTSLGRGANRLEIYPLRTASGERQMMIYFPEHQLLYTSDLFTIRGEDVFLPEMVGEAVDAAARERLMVTRAFGMHYDVLPWARIVEAARPPAAGGA